MKKLLFVLVASFAMACNSGSEKSSDREAAADEDVEIGSGAEINPQLELDSGDARFEVDTISSPQEAQQEAKQDDF